MNTRFAIVIPAFNGQDLLHRSMTSISRQRFGERLRAHQVEVVVAVNDGGRQTVAEARRLAPLVEAAGIRCRVIRTDRGRPAAFTAAEATLPPGPRLYLDQDAALSDGALCRLAEVLGPEAGARFATLRPSVAVARSRVTRSSYRAWLDLPYVRASPVSAGAYAVSEAGRARWSDWPDVGSDDKYVRLQFTVSERRRVESETYEVVAPEGFAAVVEARRRYLRGSAELARVIGDAEDVSRRHGMLTFGRRPANWADGLVFLTVYGWARLAETRSTRRTV